MGMWNDSKPDLEMERESIYNVLHAPMALKGFKFMPAEQSQFNREYVQMLFRKCKKNEEGKFEEYGADFVISTSAFCIIAQLKKIKSRGQKLPIETSIAQVTNRSGRPMFELIDLEDIDKMRKQYNESDLEVTGRSARQPERSSNFDSYGDMPF
jgi:CRISPR/Cas system-associated protein Cas10 (large subunit of type III CRISPR-Cas system)